MKFTATGKVNDSQSAVNVVVAFFNNFNPESYIGIKDGKIDLEIVFEEEKLPIEIAESLNAVEKLEFTYGQHSLKESDSETEIVEENEITETPEVPEAPETPETEVANEEQMVTEEIQIPEKRNIEKEYSEAKIEITNLYLIRMNVERILDSFSEEDTIDRIYINFCNPWPRGKHNKRRLTHIRQLEHYKVFLKKGGEIFFKTDSDYLFEDSLNYFKDSGFEIEKITYDLHNDMIFEDILNMMIK